MSKARAAIDRHYFLGDALIRTGEALGAFLLCLLALTGFQLQALSEEARLPFGLVIAIAAASALALAVSGYRMRRSAAALDRDG
jgi:hypothetical protein